ncbi:MAG: glycosyltransferase [Terracidiphilus sp.]|jgi:glycosyltransferase involved in cell wall biosynthesis
MNPLNVLLVTYVFPPVGGVGVLRAASFARYMPAEGIRLDVLTTRNPSAVGTDPTLLSEIPAEVTVHRTLTLDLPFSLKKRIKRLIAGRKPPAGNPAATAAAGKPSLLKRVIGDILQPDPQVTWFPVLTRAARRIVRERSIDLVLITAPPFSNVLLVEKLRKEFPRLAIVVDFRDEWLSTAFDLVSFLFSRSERARSVARNAEASAVTNATAVVAVTEAARREIRARYPQEPESKFHLIPNGFDTTRLRRSASSAEPRHDDKIVVTYVGTVYASTEPTTLIRALQSLSPEVKSRFKFRFIGHIEEPRYREALLQLGDMVELKGYLPQHEALVAMDETDYVLLINHDPLNVGGKFYDYVGGGKPILGVVHPGGETRRLFDELRAGWWADVQDVEGIRRLFLDAAARGESLASAFQPDVEKIAQYERKVLAQRYAVLLHSIAERQRESDSQALAAQPTGAGE